MSHESTAIAVFDISSGSIAGAHALVKKTGEGIVLASTRVHAPLQEDLDIERFVSEAVTHMGEVTAYLQKNDVHHPARIFLTLSSPWYVSQTRSIIYKKEAPFACTEKLIEGLVDAEIAHMAEHELAMFGPFGNESTIIEKQISAISLNGYQTNKPYGKKAMMLECVLTVTISPKSIIEKFTDALRRAYGTKHIQVTTAPYALHLTLRDYMHTAQAEAFMVDVTEEVTDIAVIKNGTFLYQHSFPIAPYTFYRSLAAGTKASILETKALLESYRMKKLAPVQANAIEKTIRQFSADWERGLQEALNDVHFGFSLPTKCFIRAETHFAAILANTVVKDPFLQHSAAGTMITTTVITEDVVAPFVSGWEIGRFDSRIATGILFAARIIYYN